MMHRLLGDFQDVDGRKELAFARLDEWESPQWLLEKGRVAGASMELAGVVFGDETSGPVLLMTALPPGANPPDAPPHGHASDNWRISLAGTLPMGRDRYGPGEFRFQKGWTHYASDNFSIGDGDGWGWMILLFGDRRGIRQRMVKAGAHSEPVADRLLAEWLGINGDLVSQDPAETAGPAAMVTTFASTKANVNGAFAETDDWLGPFGSTRIAAGLFGDPVSGPLLLMGATDAGCVAALDCSVDHDVFWTVAAGSCTIGDHVYQVGDMQVRPAGVEVGEVVAGPDGLQEFAVIADRRAVVTTPDQVGWPGAVDSMLSMLSEQLATQASRAK